MDLELGISLGEIEQLDGRRVGGKVLDGDAVVVRAWLEVLLSLTGTREGRRQRVFGARDAEVLAARKHKRSA